MHIKMKIKTTYMVLYLTIHSTNTYHDRYELINRNKCTAVCICTLHQKYIWIHCCFFINVWFVKTGYTHGITFLSETQWHVNENVLCRNSYKAEKNMYSCTICDFTVWSVCQRKVTNMNEEKCVLLEWAHAFLWRIMRRRGVISVL